MAVVYGRALLSVAQLNVQQQCCRNCLHLGKPCQARASPEYFLAAWAHFRQSNRMKSPMGLVLLWLQVARLMGTGLHHVRKLEQRAMAFLRTLNMADSLHAAESVN